MPIVAPEPPSLEEMLAAEKARRGVPPERLVFVGMANVAKYWWCAQFAVAKSRANELEFFGAYRRIVLGRASERGDVVDSSDVLAYARSLTQDDAEAAFRPSLDRHNRMSALGRSPPHDPERDDSGEAIERGMPGGIRAEQRYAEVYPSLMWQWERGGYVLVGDPDGITDDLVYEFKTTLYQFMFQCNLPVARAQADLYGHFWRRPKKRIQFFLRETQAVQTLEEPVDSSNAIRTLELFGAVERGKPPTPPREWKCRKCELAPTCPIRPAIRQ